MKSLHRLMIKGGVLSPSELKAICVYVENMGLNAISFGSRQDIIFPEALEDQHITSVGNFKLIDPEKTKSENISSSYLCADIFPRTPWLTSDKYLYVLEQFKKEYELKINITDPKQRLVPLFSGHLNFIASENEDYWYLYIRLPHWDTAEPYPALIYSWDIAGITNTIQNLLKEEPHNTEMIFELVNDALESNNQTIEEALHIPFHPFPYYEGMNKIGTDKYWLGLYWRNNRYDLAFLKALCELCSECKIGKISITPWKSFIINGIPRETKLIWEKFLGKYGINVRHSLLELNWHLPVGDNDALELKKFLVQNFDKNDISTYGLTFGISNLKNKGYYFTSVVIEKNAAPKELSDYNIRDTYNLLYARNFDPNTREYITHVQEVDRIALPNLLMELSVLYFEQLGTENDVVETPEKVEEEEIHVDVFQCTNCLTVYDETFGDLTQNIAANTAFSDLPDNYTCALCGSSKTSYKKKTLVRKSTSDS